jgi:hypothetical protein
VKSIILCGCVAFGFSLVFLVLVQFFPAWMNLAAIILGITVMVALIVFVAVEPSKYIS